MTECLHPEAQRKAFGCDTGDWEWCCNCGALRQIYPKTEAWVLPADHTAASTLREQVKKWRESDGLELRRANKLEDERDALRAALTEAQRMLVSIEPIARAGLVGLPLVGNEQVYAAVKEVTDWRAALHTPTGAGGQHAE